MNIAIEYAERMALRQAADNAQAKHTAAAIIAAVASAVAIIDDPRQRLATQVGLLQSEIRNLLPEPDARFLPKGSHFCKAEIDGLGDCVIHYDYSPGRPCVHTLRNGDPGYPEDPAELTVTVVQIAGCEFGAEVFSEEVQERLDAACRNDVEKRQEAAQAERAEHERDYA